MKKAEVSFITLAILAAAVLVLVIATIYHSSMISWVQNAIPGFQTQQPPQTSIQILRYNLAEDKIQYYDGNVFWNFEKGSATLGTKLS